MVASRRVRWLATCSAGLAGRDWRLLLGGQTISQLGDNLHRVAVLVLAFRLGGPAAPALLLMSQQIARAFALPLGGVLADRWPRRATLIGTDLARAVLAASLFLVREPNQLWWLWCAVLALQSCGALFIPAQQAAMVDVVGRERFPAANVVGTFGLQIGSFLGPALGGIMVVRWGLGPVFLTNAGSFLVSAACVAAMRFPAISARSAAGRNILIQMGIEFADSVRQIRRDAVVGAQCLVLCAQGTLATAVSASFVTLGTALTGDGAAFVGAAFTAVAVGVSGGAALGGALGVGARVTKPATALLPLVILGFCVAGIGLSQIVAVSLALLVVAGAMTMILDLVARAAVATRVPSDQLGRGFGLITLAQTLGTINGSLIAAGLLASVGAGSGLAVLGLIGALIAGSALAVLPWRDAAPVSPDDLAH